MKILSQAGQKNGPRAGPGRIGTLESQTHIVGRSFTTYLLCWPGPRQILEPEIDLIDGGTTGLDLLPVIEGYEKVLFVDAADTGRPPGTVVPIEGNTFPSFLTTQGSVHHVGLSDLLFAARMADVLPPHVCLVGIQPESTDLGLQLTDLLKNSFALALGAFADQLHRCGVHWLSMNPLEVYKPLFHICTDQAHADSVAHIDALETAHQPAFGWRRKEAYPRAFGRGACDDRVKKLPDS